LNKKDIIEEFFEILDKNYKTKKFKELLRGKRTLFLSKDQNNTSITLEKLLSQKLEIRKAVLQNEISSISKVLDNGILLFTTMTIDPKLNNNFEKIQSGNELLENIKRQHKEFTSFLKKISLYRYRSEETKKLKSIKTKTIRVVEITKNYNIHLHNIVLLKDIKDFKHYFKSLYLARKKFEIGRVEIAIDCNYYNLIKKEFGKGIKVIENKKQKVLKLRKLDELDVVLNTKKSNGNMIYLKQIKDNENKKQHITKYLFKYLLKNKDESLETKLCNYLQIRQIQFSPDFFDTKLPKDVLYKLSFILYNKIKNDKNNYKQIFSELDSEEKLYSIIYYVSEMIKNNKFEIHKIEKDKKIGYVVIYTDERGEDHLILDTFPKYEKIEDSEEMIKYYELLLLEQNRKLNIKNFSNLWNDLMFEIFDDFENYMIDVDKEKEERKKEREDKEKRLEKLYEEYLNNPNKEVCENF